MSPYTNAPAPFGSFPTPKTDALSIPPLGGLGSQCLLDFVKEEGVVPEYAIFAKKSGVICENNSWTACYNK